MRDHSDWCPGCWERLSRCACGEDTRLTPAQRQRRREEDRAERIIAEREWDDYTRGRHHG